MVITDPISICLAISSECVQVLMCIVPIVFCDMNGHAVAKFIAYQIMKNLLYDIILKYGLVEIHQS